MVQPTSRVDQTAFVQTNVILRESNQSVPLVIQVQEEQNNSRRLDGILKIGTREINVGHLLYSGSNIEYGLGSDLIEGRALEVREFEVSNAQSKNIRNCFIQCMEQLAWKEGCEGRVVFYAKNNAQVYLQRNGFKVQSAVDDDFRKTDVFLPSEVDSDLARGVWCEWDTLIMYLPQEQILNHKEERVTLLAEKEARDSCCACGCLDSIVTTIKDIALKISGFGGGPSYIRINLDGSNLFEI